jgi:hypothetical protein
VSALSFVRLHFGCLLHSGSSRLRLRCYAISCLQDFLDLQAFVLCNLNAAFLAKYLYIRQKKKYYQVLLKSGKKQAKTRIFKILIKYSQVLLKSGKQQAKNKNLQDSHKILSGTAEIRQIQKN